ncbi:MAG: peptide chain release factor 1 [Planctomycetota bacterium]
MAFLDALENLSKRFDEVDILIADPVVIADQLRFTTLLKERGGLESKVRAYREFRSAQSELADAEELAGTLDDPEEKELFEVEAANLKTQLKARLEGLREIFVTDDEDANRNAIVEIRAGTGGDEAALFCGSLFRMYSLYAELKGWKLEILNESEGSVGGFKEITLNVSGDGVYRRLKYESGGHRVQRVPETESQGRIHTSAATVAVLPEATAVEVNIREQDLRIDTYRSSGPGGQSVNKTSSAIRITHEPTGLIVTCQDEKSQHKNRARALKILASRLYEVEKQKRESERSSARKQLIGSGDRSQRIRTYNFPQNRVSDHRINLTLYSLDRVMQGDLDPMLEPMMEYDKEQKLQDLDD